MLAAVFAGEPAIMSVRGEGIAFDFSSWMPPPPPPAGILRRSDASKCDRVASISPRSTENVEKTEGSNTFTRIMEATPSHAAAKIQDRKSTRLNSSHLGI